MMQVGQILVALGHLRSFMDIWLFCLLDKQFESIYLTCVTLKCQITPEIRLQCINGNSLILIPKQETYNQTKPVQNIFSTQLEIASYRTQLDSKGAVKRDESGLSRKRPKTVHFGLNSPSSSVVVFSVAGKSQLAVFSLSSLRSHQLLVRTVRRSLIRTRTQL